MQEKSLNNCVIYGEKIHSFSYIIIFTSLYIIYDIKSFKTNQTTHNHYNILCIGNYT